MLFKISQSSQEHTRSRVSTLIKFLGWACNFIKEETPKKVFSCKFCKNLKNIYFLEHLGTAAFASTINCFQHCHKSSYYHLIFLWTSVFAEDLQTAASASTVDCFQHCHKSSYNHLIFWTPFVLFFFRFFYLSTRFLYILTRSSL